MVSAQLGCLAAPLAGLVPNPRDLRRNGRYRRYRAPVSVKHLHFQGDSLPLARRIEAKAQLERTPINTVLLRLLSRGLDAEAAEASRRGESV